MRNALYRLWAPMRMLGVLVHILWGLATLMIIFPMTGQTRRNRIMRFWTQAILSAVGVKVMVRGSTMDPRLVSGVVEGSNGRVLLANHVSWLDIHAINAVVPSRFVAKAEIAQWPLVGRLVALAGTLFVERGSRRAIHAINVTVAERLRHGETIGVFPEGTTTMGDRVLPFHANLVQPALDASADVHPVALRYLQHGQPTTLAAYIDDMTLVASLWRVAQQSGVTAELTWLPAVNTEGQHRHAVAQAARDAVAAVLFREPPTMVAHAVKAADSAESLNHS